MKDDYMKKQLFLNKICEILEIDINSLVGDESLDSLDNWDSLAVISFIALADEELSIIVDADKLSSAESISDLLSLVRDKIET